MDTAGQFPFVLIDDRGRGYFGVSSGRAGSRKNGQCERGSFRRLGDECSI